MTTHDAALHRAIYEEFLRDYGFPCHGDDNVEWPALPNYLGWQYMIAKLPLPREYIGWTAVLDERPAKPGVLRTPMCLAFFYSCVFTLEFTNKFFGRHIPIWVFKR